MPPERTRPPRLPWYRPRNFLFAAVLLIVGLAGYVLFVAYTAKPGSAIDYAQEMNELARSMQPGDKDAPNRWGEYSDLMEEFHNFIKQHEGDRDYETLGEPFDFRYVWEPLELTPDEYPALRQDAIDCLAKLREAAFFERMRAFVEPGAVYYEYTRGACLISASRIDLTHLSQPFSALMAEAYLAFEDGRPEDSLHAAAGVLAISRIGMCEPLLITQLRALRMRFLLFERLQHAASHGWIDAGTASSLLAMIDREESFVHPISFGGERMGLLDMIQRTHTDDGHGDGMFLPRELTVLDPGGTGVTPAHPIANAAGLVFPSKKTTTAKAEHYLAMVERRASMNAVRRRSDRPKPDEWIDRELGAMDKILKIMLPAVDSASTRYDQDRAGTGLTRLLLALVIYHDEQGVYPASLDELVPGVLAALPKDPFAPDGAFRYLKRTPTPDDSRGFVLYSVGADETDDGGRYIDNTEALREGSGVGMDFVMNPPVAESVNE